MHAPPHAAAGHQPDNLFTHTSLTGKIHDGDVINREVPEVISEIVGMRLSGRGQNSIGHTVTSML